MPESYDTAKATFPAGPIDLIAWGSLIDADPAITIKRTGQPAWVDADTVRTEFAATLSEDEQTALAANAAAYAGQTAIPSQPALADGTPVVAPRPTYHDGRAFVYFSMLCPIQPPDSGAGETETVNIYDHLITTELRASGGNYEIVGSGHGVGDTIAFEVVDKDGVLEALHGQPAGVVVPIADFVRDLHVNPANTSAVEIQSDGVTPVIAGLYFRMRYTSRNVDGTACSIIGRIKVYE